MLLATHIIRFIAAEDGNEYLGQPVDVARDVGEDIYNEHEVKAHIITGDIYQAEVSGGIRTVKELLAPISLRECNYIRCMGLNYRDHSAVSYTCF
jgi:hypothetical protein